MRPIKGLLIYALSLLVGLTVATQWTATHLPRGAGGSHVKVLSFAWYPPWSLIGWHQRFARITPRLFQQAFAIIALHALLGTVTVLISMNHRPVVRPIGIGRWGTLRDMKRAGLLSATGRIVGRFRKRVLRYNGPEPTLVIGPSRSGKGVGHVIPTLLTWPESALVHDIKGELEKETVGFRSKFSHCLVFNPTRSDSARYNPLLEIRKGAQEIRDTQNIVEMLVNPDGSKEQMDVWDQHSSQLLVALILHVMYTEPDGRKHLGVVREHLLDWTNVCRDMIEVPHRLNPSTGAPEPHPEVARVAAELMRQAPKFSAGVRATAQGYLALYADEIVCRNVAVSDFMASDLACAENPVTVYLQPPPSDVPRLRPLIRLILNQICRALLERLDTDNRGRMKHYRLLLELDEFAILGRLGFFTDNLREMAGYGLIAHLIIQSFLDLFEKYGTSQTITDNCHVIAVFACADTLTAERVSKMTGVVIEYRESFGHKRWLRFIPDTVQQSEQLRPLMQPGDVRMLPGNEQLVFVNGHPPMRTVKVRYYKDSEFKGLVVPPPQQSDGVDSPREIVSRELGVRHDWLGERAKGLRVVSDEIFASELDEEWTAPSGIGPRQVEPPSTPGEDAYGL